MLNEALRSLPQDVQAIVGTSINYEDNFEIVVELLVQARQLREQPVEICFAFVNRDDKR